MPAYLRPAAVTLDCPDPLALAAFYQEATGLTRHPGSDAEFAALTAPDGFTLGFQRVEDYRPPRWPGQDAPQQLHLCYDVDEDLTATEARLVALGAAVPDHQPHDPAHARVLMDPAGHPFCVVREKKANGKG
ncbi:VOC family protein [Streptomyces sp. CA-253872]|uniref:VOC family protein n=1 Tax=Streptomyces sp. CA-253872 TaxID=3240067 RepID=UPI003D8A0101